VAADKFKVAHQHHNTGIGVIKAQNVDATMDFMKKYGVFFKSPEESSVMHPSP